MLELETVTSHSVGRSAPRFECDLSAKLHLASWTYESRVDRWNLVYLPDYVGMPLLLTDDQHRLLKLFAQGGAVGDVLVRAQTLGLGRLPDLLETIFYLEDKGFLRGEADAPRFNPGKLPDSASLKSMNIWLHVTNNCNLACAYCFVDHSRSTLTDDSICGISRKIGSTARKHGVESVVIKLAGGEPTLRIDLIEKFERQLASDLAGLGVSLRWAFVTNGTHVTDRILEFIHRTGASINISLDGFGEYHDLYRIYKSPGGVTTSDIPPPGQRRGSWDRIMRNVERFVSAGATPNINATISRESAGGLLDLVRWIYGNGMVGHLGVVRNLACDWKDGVGRRESYRAYCDLLAETFDTAFNELEKPEYRLILPSSLEICELHFDYPAEGVCCGIGANHIVIREDGKLASCPMTVSEQAVEATDDLFESSRRTFDINPEERGDRGDCLSCQWYRVCSSGCPVANDRFNGHPFTKSPLCSFWKFVIPRYVNFYGRKLSQTVPEMAS